MSVNCRNSEDHPLSSRTLIFFCLSDSAPVYKASASSLFLPLHSLPLSSVPARPLTLTLTLTPLCLLGSNLPSSIRLSANSQTPVSRSFFVGLHLLSTSSLSTACTRIMHRLSFQDRISSQTPVSSYSSPILHPISPALLHSLAADSRLY